MSWALTLIRGLVKFEKFMNKTNEEIWALGQAKGKSQKFYFAKCYSESTFGNGFFSSFMW